MNKSRNLAALLIAVFFSAVAQLASGQAEILTLKQVVQDAITNNPQTRASQYNFEAAHQEHRVAKGRYLPSVDLNAQTGQIDSDNPQFLSEKYRSTSARLSVTQNLFNGGETRYLVKKLDRLKHARYYEFQDESENLALEVVQAYLDVQRYRQLVTLAEENYIEHRLIYNDIEQRVSAGISRAVDFQQAEARLALAETNLLTENTNLHDVSRRYTRLLGQLPGDSLAAATLSNSIIPSSRNAALMEAYDQSPALKAASYNYLASQAEYKEKKAPYMPTLDLRARKDTYDDDTNGLNDVFDETAIELVLTFNLYRGGSDRATRRQFNELINVRREEREQVCRDVTQTVTIAYNNVLSIQKQIELLQRNKQASENVRTAYRNQFDIGQRTLLDLLDTENEYFDVSRSLVNAEHDLFIAEASTLAGMGQLLTALGVQAIESNDSEKLKLDEDVEISSFCQVTLEDEQDIDRQEILARVLASDRLKPRVVAPPPAPAPEPEPAEPRQLSFRLNVQYQNGSAALLPNYMGDVEIAAEYLRDNPNVRGIIEGHTDSKGSAEYNMTLSQARAETLKSTLVRDFGIAEERLTARGYGEQVPIATNETEEGRRQNRRVLLVIVDE